MKNISKGYEDISVSVVDYTKDIAKHVWDCYKMTWRSLQNIEYDPSNPVIQKAVKDVGMFRALPMPREQAFLTFRINHVSRVMLAQITRQRLAGFNVESQMPEPIEHNVLVPLNIASNPKLFEKAQKLAKDSQNLYDECIAEGIPPQDARYLALHGQTTSLVYVSNVNVFTGSFAMRCENNLSDEINLAYRLMKKAIYEELKTDLDFGYIDQLSFDFYIMIIKNADAMGAARKVGNNYDKVFGNSFARYPSANDEIDEITKNCSYDFRKSAWYLEMQKLDKSLLFKDEKEMIESWK